MQKKRLLRKKAHSLQAIVQIGKSGLTEGMLGEIKRQLKIRKTIKVRFLRSVPTTPGYRNEIIHRILDETKAVLLTHTGSVIALHKD